VRNLGGTFNCPNDEPNFDPRIERELGCYVYVLKDRGSIFYVGKGGGRGTGNDRVLQHLDHARKRLKSSSPNISKKIQRIHEIWARGEKVEWEIIRYGLPDSQSAFEVEAALIDLVGRDKLTNEQGGHDTLRKGRLSSSEVYRLSAPHVAPKADYAKVLIFNIDKGLKLGGRSPYDATRGWWAKTRKHEDATHAVGVVRGVSFCVVEINRWLSWEEDTRLAGIEGYPSDFDQQNDWEKEKLRRGFDGNFFLESGSHELLDKNYTSIISEASGSWGFGNWLAVKFRSGSPILLKGIKKS
jgi:hypothetical protein